MVALSARTAEALRARIADLRAALAPDGMIHSGVLGGGDLTDVAHTLAVRRTHFRHRVALFARDLADLRAQLDRLLAGAEPVRGDTDLDRVARDWQRGEGDLAAVFADLPGRPVSLPGYPFARDRHWIAAPAVPVPAAPVAAPVEVPEPAAPEAVEPVTLALAPDAPLVADHVVSGTPVLPGTATVALAVTAARRAGLTGPLRLRDVTWLRPLAVDRPTTATLTVGGTGFDLAPDGGEPCATGRLATGGEPERVDLVAARARCARSVPPADLYSAFDRAGLRYGPGFRVVTDLRAGADEVLATLAPREPDGHRPDPRVLDGALQTVAALVGERPTPLVPHSVDEVVVHADDGTPTHAHAVRASGEDRFDVRLCDADGRVLVSFAGLALRPHRGAAPAVPVYVPRWTPAPAPVRARGPVRGGGGHRAGAGV
ncbi:polyketide synthase dehydratase domain-containing protein, partial [Saccharothrix sp. MB29]|nr:polyketide synthase dehydratase domain-containing protein [Saccharothrix sp. MB29]